MRKSCEIVLESGNVNIKASVVGCSGSFEIYGHDFKIKPVNTAVCFFSGDIHLLNTGMK